MSSINQSFQHYIFQKSPRQRKSIKSNSASECLEGSHFILQFQRGNRKCIREVCLSSDKMRPIKVVRLHALFQMTKFLRLEAPQQVEPDVPLFSLPAVSSRHFIAAPDVQFFWLFSSLTSCVSKLNYFLLMTVSDLFILISGT